MRERERYTVCITHIVSNFRLHRTIILAILVDITWPLLSHRERENRVFSQHHEVDIEREKEKNKNWLKFVPFSINTNNIFCHRSGY